MIFGGEYLRTSGFYSIGIVLAIEIFLLAVECFFVYYKVAFCVGIGYTNSFTYCCGYGFYKILTWWEDDDDMFAGLLGWD